MISIQDFHDNYGFIDLIVNFIKQQSDRSIRADALARFYEIIGSDERWLNESHLLELRELSVLLVRTYLKLSAEALKNKVRAWKAVPKFHVFQHICEIQAAVFGNPRRYWTYSDEDLQRIMKMIALSVHTENVPPLALYKWLTLLFEDA